MTGNRNIGMKSARNQYGVAVAYHSHQLWVLRIAIHKLKAKGRIGHVEVDVHLLQQRCVLMGRPTRPISRLRICESHNKPSCLNVFCEQQVQVTSASGAAGAEFQTRILRDLR